MKTVVTFCWCTADSLSLLFRRNHRGINAGICIAIDAFLSLGLIASLVCTGLFENWWAGDSLASGFLTAATRDRLAGAAVGLGSAGT